MKAYLKSGRKLQIALFFALIAPFSFGVGMYAHGSLPGVTEDPAIKPKTEVIKVSGTHWSSNSWTVSCRGMACMGTADADSLKNLIEQMLKKQFLEFQDIEDAKETFCTEMRSNRPAGCEQYSNEPATNNSQYPPAPMLNLRRFNPSTWTNFPPIINGCGTGSIGEAIGTIVSSIAFDDFSGNVDEPLSGFNFYPACANHDVCYSGQGGKGICDDAFGAEMRDICGGSSRCRDYSAAFRAAVGLGGEDAYDNAGAVQQCKNFKEDMSENGCVSGGLSGNTGSF